MPLHERVIPEELKESLSYLDALVSRVVQGMDGVPHSPRDRVRWDIVSTSLYVATEHADAISTLVKRHSNEAAGLHLRALFEVYVRLAYMLSKVDNSRLIAVLYADAEAFRRYSKDVKRTNRKAREFAPAEVQDDLSEIDSSLAKRIKSAERQKKEYRRQLEALGSTEFVDDEQNLKSSGDIRKQLSIEYICKNLLGVDGQSLLGEYASIYGNLSMYAHTNTVHLSGMIHRDSDGSVSIGTVPSDKNKEFSIRNVSVAYHYLLGAYIQCLREKGLSEKEMGNSLTELSDMQIRLNKLFSV